MVMMMCASSPPSFPLRRPLRQVRTSSCRERLGRYIRELDHLLQALTPQPPPGSTQTGDVGDSKGEKEVTGRETLQLRDNGWGQEDRIAMGRFCEEVCMGLRVTVPLGSAVLSLFLKDFCFVFGVAHHPAACWSAVANSTR